LKLAVTDGDERAALAATRSLGRHHEVHVLGPGRTSLAGESRHAHAHHRVPDAAQDVDAFARAVATLCAAERIEAVLPTTDAACRALIPARKRLEPAVLLAPELEPYLRASHKGLVARLAPRFGLAVPEGGEASNLEEALALARALDGPMVVRPVESVSRDGAGLRKRGVFRAADASALAASWPERVGADAALVQRPVAGRGEGIFLLRWRGRTLAAFAHRRLREKPPEGGVSVLRESIALDPLRLRGVEALLDELGFEGVAMAEFKSDGRTAWLIELNARLWGSLQLALDAGLDFPQLLLEAYTGGGPSQVFPSYELGVRSRWLLGDVDHAIALAKGRAGADGRAGVAAALRVLLGSSGARSRFEVLRRDDARPFVYELRRWLASALR
jgi:predicted ATP-grasp superfamily ATP-dependent carboligase